MKSTNREMIIDRLLVVLAVVSLAASIVLYRYLSTIYPLETTAAFHGRFYRDLIWRSDIITWLIGRTMNCEDTSSDCYQRYCRIPYEFSVTNSKSMQYNGTLLFHY